MSGKKGRALPPRAGKGNYSYRKTRNLNLTPGEIAAGWTIETCITCGAGEYRAQDTCELCGGAGQIAVFNGIADREPPRKKKGAA